MKSFTGLQKMAFDVSYDNTIEFSKKEMEDAIRKSVVDACGGEWNYYSFMESRYKVFQIIAQVMPVAMNASLAGRFGNFADFVDTAMGDENYFVVEDKQLYPVLTSARGNQDVERMKIVDGIFQVPTQMKIIKFYDEFDRWMAGKIDLARLTSRATDSYENYVGQLIANTIYGSYSAVGTNYKATGAFSATTLESIIENVKAATGATAVQIWGTTTALGKITDGFGYSDTAKDRANTLGYWGEFRGSSMFAMPQAFLAGTTTFGVNTDHIIIVPANEKIVKVAFEGEPVVNVTDGMGRNDMQPEFTYGRRVGASAITSVDGLYGFYKFS